MKSKLGLEFEHDLEIHIEDFIQKEYKEMFGEDISDFIIFFGFNPTDDVLYSHQDIRIIRIILKDKGTHTLSITGSTAYTIKDFYPFLRKWIKTLDIRPEIEGKAFMWKEEMENFFKKGTN